MVVDSTQASTAKIDTWKYHDRRKPERCRDAAYRFFNSVTDSDEDSLRHAGEMVRRAFWLADEAEKYQGENSKRENYFYDCAENCLKEAFRSIKAPMEIATHRREWWQNYRHRNSLDPHLEQDLRLQLGAQYTEEDKQRFLEATSLHDEDKWEQAVQKLEPLYKKIVYR